jgi:uncharacterized protein with ATP-grasp and redox domains
MKASVECIPCYFRQILSIVQRVTRDEALQERVFKEVGRDVLPRLTLEKSPAENTYEIIKAIDRIFGSPLDPFSEERDKYNRIALNMYSELWDIVHSAPEMLRTAVQVAVAGNIIDLGILEAFDIRRTLENILAKGFAIDHFAQFKDAVLKAKNILYLLDNAGEIVFDRILIETTKSMFPEKHIIAAVNEGPILNDATYSDALMVGLGKVAEVITTGTDTIGKHPEKGQPSEGFREAFSSADVIIAKGHGNYEMLNDTTYNIFFILQAKCNVVAKSLGVKVGDAVLLKNGTIRT